MLFADYRNAGFQFLMKWEFSLSTMSSFVAEPTQPAIQRLVGGLSPRKKRLELGRDIFFFLLLSTAESEDVWGAINLSSGIHVCDSVKSGGRLLLKIPTYEYSLS